MVYANSKFVYFLVITVFCTSITQDVYCPEEKASSTSNKLKAIEDPELDECRLLCISDMKRFFGLATLAPLDCIKKVITDFNHQDYAKIYNVQLYVSNFINYVSEENILLPGAFCKVRADENRGLTEKGNKQLQKKCMKNITKFNPSISLYPSLKKSILELAIMNYKKGEKTIGFEYAKNSDGYLYLVHIAENVMLSEHGKKNMKNPKKFCRHLIIHPDQTRR